MQSKQYFTKIKNYPHEKSTEPEFNYIEKLSEYFLNSPMNIENISVFLRS
jgi:hypothetical protein